MGLHLKKLALSFFLLSLAGCSKDSPSVPRVPTTAEQINKAQQEALALIDPLKIKKGEFAYFIETQEIYTGQQDPSISLMEEESLTVLDRVEGPGYLEITVQKEVIDHLLEGSPHSIFKDVFYVSTSPDIPEVPEEESQEEPPVEEPKESPILFFNLKVADERISKPKKVIEKYPCATETECSINVKKISYDIVFTDPAAPQTTKVETWVSSEVPYFASILKNCYTTVVSVETARPLVRQCKSVLDYQFESLTSL